jgi:DNA-binding winged helix-turn-helix (wHTH) protein
MSNGDKASVLRFGVFELDIQSDQLLKNGLAIKLKPQPFKLLKLLINEAGRVVTREEIRAELWTGDTFVDFEQGVNFAIKQVREALDDDSDRSLYIQTVPKRGYRFVAPVEIPGFIRLSGPTSRNFALPKRSAANAAES